MHFYTPRKLAAGLGSGHGATAAHWFMSVSGIGLAILTPLFVIAVGGAIGLDRAGVVAHFGRPFAAVVTGLFVVVGMIHWIRGTFVMIDDYVQGGPRAWAQILTQLFGWAVVALTLFALARVLLAPDVAVVVPAAAPVVIVN
ncbi:succinate dehydrogenase [Paracoccus sp. S-4012]|uniref:succinate dehydrogenase, hydrophobic membrane anchor protein n=1 Tax=Paracoccus sp. S-4012 TaxID=2665648 RepID=UPI0012B090D0|nr:succinate dehydrogenase, hydrophobic membrane anchor protein [Paracoccus sp. S-4012]MRX50717.1 succinate dehydrogenase [Paracoccus sp. S-4012]